MKEFLSESIQVSQNGHCSTEDAQACMKLIKLKLSKSISYGDCVLVGREEVETQLMEARGRSQFYQYNSSIFNHVISEKTKTSAIFGNTEVMSEYSMFLANDKLSVMDDTNFKEQDNVSIFAALMQSSTWWIF